MSPLSVHRAHADWFSPFGLSGSQLNLRSAFKSTESRWWLWFFGAGRSQTGRFVSGFWEDSRVERRPSVSRFKSCGKRSQRTNFKVQRGEGQVLRVFCGKGRTPMGFATARSHPSSTQPTEKLPYAFCASNDARTPAYCLLSCRVF